MRRTLIYLSSCAVHDDGRADPFMIQERPWLLAHFERVGMVSFYGVKTLTRGDEKTIIPSRPGLACMRAWLSVFFSRDLWRELNHLRRDGRLTLENALKLLFFAQRGRKMHFWAEWLLKEYGDERATLYSCWMSFDAYAATLSKRKHPNTRFVARGHAFDIDLERNPMNPYLMKQTIVEQSDGVYLISETAKAQFMAYMEGRVQPVKVCVLAMGSGGQPVPRCKEPPLYAHGMLRLISCAKVIPIKQVPLMVEALAQWSGMPLCWTHIGGGEGMADLRRLAEEKLDRKDNVICEFLGNMDGEEIQKLYEKRAFDAFVNTSRKEGAPVSMMEAMRFGIPMIAPAVGGIPEMVAEGVGFLYEPESGADGLREALEKLCALPRSEAERMRESARKRWNEQYCSAALLPRLFPDAKLKRAK